jgi:UDP-N-acetylglucosamine pyrophosphorylase
MPESAYRDHQGQLAYRQTLLAYIDSLPQPIQNSTDFNVMIELPTGTGVYIQAVAKSVRTEEWMEQGRRVVGIAAVLRRREIIQTN